MSKQLLRSYFFHWNRLWKSVIWSQRGEGWYGKTRVARSSRYNKNVLFWKI